MTLRELRRERGLTLAAVGRQVGLSESSLSYIEAGKRRPSPAAAEKLGALFAVNPVELWPTFVYCCVNDARDVIYVGMTNHPARRRAELVRWKPWGAEIATFDSHPVGEEDEARAAERRLIRDWLPRYNVQHAGRRRAATPEVLHNGDVAVNFRLAVAEYEELTALAAREYRNLSGQLRWIVERHLREVRAA